MPVYKDKNPTKDGRQWFFRTRYKDLDGTKKQYHSKKYATRHEALDAEAEFKIKALEESNVSTVTFKQMIELFIEQRSSIVKETTMLGVLLDESFIMIHQEVGKNLKIVYSPLHGTGNIPVQTVLEELGFENVYVVPEQELPNGNFPTVDYPNPEDKKAFKLALELAKKEDADLVLATDPDADRLGVLAKDTKTGEYIPFTGNMSGLLIAEYILSQRKEKKLLPKNGALISTIVSSNLAIALAKEYKIDFIEVLTGFKYIGEQIRNFENTGSNEYVFGFEESYGCLVGTHARDKDAVTAVMILCEAAAYYKKKGLTLWDQMKNIYKELYSDLGIERNDTDLSDWAETVAPTQTTKGEKQRTCKREGRPIGLYNLYNKLGYWEYLNNPNLEAEAKYWYVSHPRIVYASYTNDSVVNTKDNDKLFILKQDSDTSENLVFNTILKQKYKNLSGYAGLLFVKVKNNNVRKFMYCTKGTDVNSINDWICEDLLQGLTGFSLQHIQLMYIHILAFL